jgi:DnaK suppressor protein
LENKQVELGNGNWNREALAIQRSSEDLDRIQQASDRDWAMGNLARNSSRLREVRAALGRVDAGTFGICAECEEEINPKRLTAVPWASLCIVCQEAADLAEEAAGAEIEPSLVLAA